MVKRTERQSFKHLLFVAFALIVMMMCWESNRTNAAVVSPLIPEESIRLRILANSDSAQDQALKREIRDAIIARMEEWVVGPHSLEEARAVVRQHLPEFDELVGQMIQERGYTYTHSVELGVVPFPTKMYGNDIYPAGDYEALRVVIGSGEGQNWWCVLFPPLCFVDSVSGEAIAASAVVAKTEGKDKPAETAQAETKAAKNEKSAKDGSAKVSPSPSAKAATKAAAAEKVTAAADTSTDAPEKPQVKFFVWEVIQKIASWFS
ncbi:stage II sporulation protein R [Paenibacillus whitsoniae]|uniref:Stage II sporulation protein R n=1 Tax=Paenibacillus whitsoniae TaxID=2496558 RepID=A0A430JDA8_9BACL|nr:stage II sporulation protein R [Paenibacillus whitsoniae]RTE08997.1 stage II sporulation protein R [Paenibacillus whitsoniae]